MLVSLFVLQIGLLLQPTATEAQPESEVQLSLSASIAPETATKIPIVPMTFQVHYRERALTFQDPRTFDKKLPPIFTHNFSDSMPQISSFKFSIPKKNIKRLTYVQLSGQDLFSDTAFFHQDILFKDPDPANPSENNCLFESDEKVSCKLIFPSFQALGADSPSMVEMTIRIFRKGSISKGALPFFPIKTNEKSEDYLKQFSRPEEKNARDLREDSSNYYGYFLYSVLVFDSCKESDLPTLRRYGVSEEDKANEEKNRAAYPWNVLKYSKRQGVGRIAVLPDQYRIEREMKFEDGRVQKQWATVDLTKWGTFISEDKVIWNDLDH